MSVKYLFIFEDNSKVVRDEISEDDKGAVEDGVLDVVRFNSDDESITEYSAGEWVEVGG